MYQRAKNGRKSFRITLWLAASAAAILFLNTSQAQEPGPRHPPRPQLSLQAQASAELAQDTVRITIASELSGDTQADVAGRLSKTMDEVMKEAKADSRVAATTGNFRVWPMNDKSGKIVAWHARGEIRLQSKDFGAASALAAALGDRMPIANIDFSVSSDARAKKEQALLSEAAQAFLDQAQAAAEAFGFQSYSLKDIELTGGFMPFQAAPRMMAAAMDKAEVPLEAGTETVTVSVRGSIFLRSPNR